MAHYFVGCNMEQGLIYLDPHFVQDKKEKIYRYEHPRVIEMRDLDPAISFGYVVRSYEEYQSFTQNIQKINYGLSEEMKIVTFQNKERVDEKQGLLYSFASIKSDYIK